ncbi:MAG: ACT domain-containing protein [Kiritimatiellae bacterium]|nr:ACT domain-containing protein [Kiritimatiellia bacterium]
MHKKKVLIATKLDGIARQILLANGRYRVVQDADSGLAALAGKHADAHALIVRSEKVPAAVIDLFPKLKVIVRAGSGYDTIDAKYARTKGIDVMNTPGANSNAVAEEVLALILADARHILAGDRSVRRGRWEKAKFMGREIAGKTIGIVGLGNVGQLVAKRLVGFDVKLLGYDPVISQDRAAEMAVRLVELDELFAKADYVTLHVPETDDTRGMVDRGLLAKMKPGATIVNCARAGIVDERALRALKKRKQLRFLNDVYARDSAGPKSVADIADVMLPHLGASTAEANQKAARRAAEQIIELEEKGVTSFIVNRDIPEGLDEAYCELAYLLMRLCRCITGKDSKLKTIETSFYGDLQPYADWLLVPITSALNENVDRTIDCRMAREYLDEMGVDYVNRVTDPSKGYGNSITVDLTCSLESGKLSWASVRGTVAESTLMISRINEFDKLYFEPTGYAVFFLYEDRPGVLGQIGATLAKAGVNIEDVRQPHDPKTNRSLAAMRVNKAVPEQIFQRIGKEIHALSSFAVKF